MKQLQAAAHSLAVCIQVRQILIDYQACFDDLEFHKAVKLLEIDVCDFLARIQFQKRPPHYV
ncbi:hypothetical protein [Thiolapillus sp.]